MGTSSLVQLWTLTYRYSSTPNPISSFFRNAGLSASYINYLMLRRPYLPPMGNTFNPDSLSVLTFGNLICIPLVVPARFMVILLLQSDESHSAVWKFLFSIYFWNFYAAHQFADMGQVGVAPFCSFQFIFCYLTFPGFPFILLFFASCINCELTNTNIFRYF